MSRQAVAFHDRYIPEPNSGCWLWVGSLFDNGYGQYWSTRLQRSVQAHRASYEVSCGDIPDGLHVLHRCDVRACVNPGHLFLGTHQDNMRDRNAKGRHAYAERIGKAKLTEENVRIIMADQDASDGALATRLGVSRICISQVRCGRSWKHLKLIRADDPRARHRLLSVSTNRRSQGG